MLSFIRSLRSKRGFTLIEMMTTVVIIGIAAAMVAPGFDRAVKRNDFKSTTKDLISMLRMARSYAIAEKVPHGVFFDYDDNYIRLFAEQSSPLNDTFDWGADSVMAQIELDSTNSWFYSMFTSNAIIFQPNGSASESGDIYLSYDDGEVYCFSGVSVLASTGRSKIEYISNY